jgi:hypothetical protein
MRGENAPVGDITIEKPLICDGDLPIYGLIYHFVYYWGR